MRSQEGSASRKSATSPRLAESLGYAEIADIIRRSIPSKYRPGSRIGSERDLAVEFGVNRHTVRRALTELEAQGVISIVHGSGSIVSRQRMEHRVSYETRFTASAELAGISAATKVLGGAALPTREELVIARALSNAEPTGKLTTVRYANGVPVCWIRHLFFDCDVKALAETYKSGSLHQHIAKKYGTRLRRQESRVSADKATATDVRLLFVPRTLAILCSNSLNVNAKTGAPVELSITRFRSDAVELRFDQRKAT